jgi:hypothetical protein
MRPDLFQAVQQLVLASVERLLVDLPRKQLPL